MKVVFVVGPTATGKSELALLCASRFQGEIVNADSLQVYRSLDIGTAKPTVAEREIVKHHLFDFVAEGVLFTAGDYRKKALEVVRQAEERGTRCLFFVGGSGFYIQALLKGMYRLPKPDEQVRERVRKELDENGGEAAYRRLCELDPVYAAKVGANDLYRIGRGLEICYGTGKTVSEVTSEFARTSVDCFPYEHRIVAIDADRANLRRRVSARAEKMLADGWIEEVRALRERGWGEWAPMKSVGYREIQSFLRGELPEEKLLEEIVTATMQLAKKQKTWFKNKIAAEWFDLSGREAAERLIARFLQDEKGDGQARS